MFEIQVKIIGLDGLTTAISNLANAIATGAAPAMTVQGDGIVKDAVTTMHVAGTIGDAVRTSIATAETVSEDEEEAGEVSTAERDAWGLLHDLRINTDAKSINKGDSLWRKKKRLDETFVEGIILELVKEAAAAGVYTGPAHLSPDYEPPVEVPAAPVVPVAPVVPAVPVPEVPAPEAPVTPAVTAPVEIDAKVLQGASVKMVTAMGSNASTFVPRLMKLYEVGNLTLLTGEKAVSFFNFAEQAAVSPEKFEELLATREASKLMGGAF